MTHAEKVREAERKVIEKAIAWDKAPGGRVALYATSDLHSALDHLETLSAATCPTCGGTGDREATYDSDDGRFIPRWSCPAGCDNGRTRT